jgi:hypothetical protein
MLIILMLVALGAAGYFSAALVRERGSPVRSVFVTSWIAAGVIALARLMVLYSSTFLPHSWPRPLGLFLFLVTMANSLFEMRLVNWFSGPSAVSVVFLHPTPSSAGLMALTSVPLGFVWAWIRTRPRSGPPD